jgi:PhnB protein
MKLNSYINFAGTTAEAFRYYEQHLGAKTLFTMRWNQMPGPDAAKYTPPGYEDKVLHGTLAIADTTIMAADVPKAEPMRSAYLTLSVDSNEEAERIHNALADGGEVLMAMNETFFAHRFGQVRDRFGINWMILHRKPAPNE